MGFRYDIQGLRALAVLLVFIFHLNPSWLSGGYIGVDIFFVISGYLVSSIVLHKKNENNFNFKDFYIGRIKRIVPAFVVFLIVTGLVGSWVYLSLDIKGLYRGLYRSIAFTSNSYLSGLGNYFGASSQENPILHTWTLSIEMQFYLLLPLFLIFVKRKYLVWFTFISILVFFAYSFYNSTFLSNQQEMYFSLMARIPEFLIGTFFALKGDSIKNSIKSYQNIIAIISIVGIIVCGYYFNDTIGFPGLWVVLPCIFAAFLLITTESIVNKFFSNRVLVHIGELSYSIYLWHWAIMAYIRYYYIKSVFNIFEIIIIVVLTYIISIVSYRYIENTYRLFNDKQFFKKFSLLAVCLTVVILSLFNLNRLIGTDLPDKYIKPTFGMDSHSYSFKHIEMLGNEFGRDSICLIGDSHALAYKGMFDEIGKKYNLCIKTISNDSYPLIGDFDRDCFKNDKDFGIFKNLTAESKKLIQDSKYIFIASVWWEDIKPLEKEMRSLEKSLKPWQKIIIVGDYPLMNINPIRKTRSISRANVDREIVGTIKPIPNYISDLIKHSDKVYYMSLSYKNLSSQLPYINDTIAYYDATHFNAYGSRKLYYYLENDISVFMKKIGIN